MAQPTVTGTKGYAPALTSVIAALVEQGLITDSSTATALAVAGIDSVTGPINTNSATLVDVTGLEVTIATPITAKIFAIMIVTCSTSGGGTNATGGHAVSIDGTDGDESMRFLSGINDQGVGAAMMLSVDKAAASYSVKGRFRRVSGTKDVCIDQATLFAVALA